MKRYNFSIDNAAADWWQYHFDDALLRNDISWRTWRVTLQKHLSNDQLAGRACGICGVSLARDSPHNVEYRGGYALMYCLEQCDAVTQNMQHTITAIEHGYAKL